MIDRVLTRGTNGLRRTVALAACVALVACSEELGITLKRDEAAVEVARAHLWEDRQAGNNAAAATDSRALSEAVKRLRYDRMAEPGLGNKGW